MGVMFGVRRFSTQFTYVWIVQFNAFLMTIRRKNLAPHSALVWTYGAMLLFGFLVCSYDVYLNSAWLLVNTLANTAAVLRMGFGTPKYLLWAGMAMLTHFARQTLRPQLGVPEFEWWPVLYACSNVAVLRMGYSKLKSSPNKSAEKKN